MTDPWSVGPSPTREQIVAFRKEQYIPDDGKLEPWAIENNMVLTYLCDLALSPPEELPPQILKALSIKIAALALLRELNDALLPIPDALQARVDAVLDRAEEK